MIRAMNLTKVFGEKVAVDHIDIEVKEGEIYAFLGPNGAGKTTTLKMLTGVMRPTEGKVEILGMDVWKDPVKVKREIGVVPDEPKMYPSLRGWEFLEFVRKVYKKDDEMTVERMEDLLDMFSIDYLDKYIFEMSHGMKQKLMLVSVMMRMPKVVFLDEPSVGLDVISTAILKELLKKHASEGGTVFLTTHILDMAQDVADRVGIINEGRIVAEGSVEDLKKLAGMKDLESVFIKLTGNEERLREMLDRI